MAEGLEAVSAKPERRFLSCCSYSEALQTLAREIDNRTNQDKLLGVAILLDSAIESFVIHWQSKGFDEQLADHIWDVIGQARVLYAEIAKRPLLSN